MYRFDYVPAAEAPAAGDFPGATLAEKKTDEADPASPAWLYFNQDPAKGRLVSGFYDPAFGFGLGSSDPRGVFNPVLNDFPKTISFGDEWSSTTVFTNEVSFGDPEDPEGSGLFTIPIQITYTAAAKVDAYGVAISPGISFGDCLRINELVTYDIAGDFGEGFQHLETDYIRNFYWARPGHGIVTQVTSQQQTSPPPDSFPMAAVVLRMFETNHPDSEPPPPPGIQGLTIALSKQGALLTWDRLSGVTSYRVEYTSEPGNAGGWQTLQFAHDQQFPHRRHGHHSRGHHPLLSGGRVEVTEGCHGSPPLLHHGPAAPSARQEGKPEPGTLRRCLHADRTAGGDRHHRDPGGPVAPRAVGGQGVRPDGPLPGQPQAARTGAFTLRGRLPCLPVIHVRPRGLPGSIGLLA